MSLKHETKGIIEVPDVWYEVVVLCLSNYQL